MTSTAVIFGGFGGCITIPRRDQISWNIVNRRRRRCQSLAGRIQERWSEDRLGPHHARRAAGLGGATSASRSSRGRKVEGRDTAVGGGNSPESRRCANRSKPPGGNPDRGWRRCLPLWTVPHERPASFTITRGAATDRLS